MNNADIVKEAIAQVWNQGKLDQIPNFYTEDFVCHESGITMFPWPPGHEGLKQIVSQARGAFPDYLETPELVVSEGDLVSVRQLVTGTNTGQGAFPPTGKAFRVVDTLICRLEDGKLAEQWGLIDQFAIFTQLGILPDLILPGEDA